MKIVINTCYGGFGLSHRATLEFIRRKGLIPYWVVGEITLKYDPDFDPENPKGFGIVHYGTQPDFMSEGCPGYFSDRDIARDDPVLVALVEELGEAAYTRPAKLAIVEVPDGTAWEIENYDGIEWVAETHRTWR